MKDIVFEIFPDGRAKCLYHETIDLRRLGRLALRRASRVLFRPKAQNFVVRLFDGTRLGPYASRNRAIAAEIREIHRRMMMGGKRGPARRRRSKR